MIDTSIFLTVALIFVLFGLDTRGWTSGLWFKLALVALGVKLVIEAHQLSVWLSGFTPA